MSYNRPSQVKFIVRQLGMLKPMHARNRILKTTEDMILSAFIAGQSLA
jgi:hypothetical protein